VSAQPQITTLPVPQDTVFGQIFSGTIGTAGSPSVSDTVNLQGIDKLFVHTKVTALGGHAHLSWQFEYAILKTPGGDFDWAPLSVENINKATGDAPQAIYVPQYTAPATPFSAPPLKIDVRGLLLRVKIWGDAGAPGGAVVLTIDRKALVTTSSGAAAGA